MTPIVHTHGADGSALNLVVLILIFFAALAFVAWNWGDGGRR